MRLFRHPYFIQVCFLSFVSAILVICHCRVNSSLAPAPPISVFSSPGYYCPTGASSAEQFPCPLGSYCVPGLAALPPPLCAAGYVCTTGMSSAQVRYRLHRVLDFRSRDVFQMASITLIFTFPTVGRHPLFIVMYSLIFLILFIYRCAGLGPVQSRPLVSGGLDRSARRQRLPGMVLPLRCHVLDIPSSAALVIPLE
jgi:hypothetical protein